MQLQPFLAQLKLPTGLTALPAGWCLVCELEKLAIRAHPREGPTSGALSVKSIVQNLKRISKTMRLGSQEDAHEFFVQVGGECAVCGMPRVCVWGGGGMCVSLACSELRYGC